MIEKIQKINIPQKIWIFIVGTEKPNMLTQASIAVAFCIWIYLFSWQLLSFITMLLLPTLDKAVELNTAFNRIGQDYQGILGGNITVYLLVHSLIQIVIFTAALVGLILIWRKKKIGFPVYIFSNIAVYPVTFFVMGLNYLVRESSWVDFVLLCGITLYFATGYWLFYKRKTTTNS